MRLLLFLSIWMGCFHTVYAQTATDDLDSLYSILSQTPSFRDQITGEKADSYARLFQRLRKSMHVQKSDFEQFIQLTRLIIPINDNHLDIRMEDAFPLTIQNLRDSAFMRQYRTGSFFKNYPKVKTNLSELENKLSKRRPDELEGIYYIGELKIGVYKTGEKKYTGTVLKSDLPNWTPGQIYCLIEENGSSFHTWIAGLVNKNFSFNRIVRFQNSNLDGTGLKKFPRKKTFDHLAQQPNFELKQLDKDIQYLKLTNFKVSDQNMAAAQAFNSSIKDSLTAPNLIVDLRDNGGGAYAVSTRFLNLLRLYVNPGKIFLLINYNTVSNAEQFTIKVKSLKGVTILGNTTMGRVTYGQNYGRRYALPSGKFSIVPTDMGGEAVDLKYEGIGIVPDVFLDPDKDWIEQVKVIIREKVSASGK